MKLFLVFRNQRFECVPPNKEWCTVSSLHSLCGKKILNWLFYVFGLCQINKGIFNWQQANNTQLFYALLYFFISGGFLPFCYDRWSDCFAELFVDIRWGNPLIAFGVSNDQMYKSCPGSSLEYKQQIWGDILTFYYIYLEKYQRQCYVLAFFTINICLGCVLN